MENLDLIESGLKLLSSLMGHPYQFENSVFSWQEYCYCEEEDCEKCSNQGFFYKPTMFSVSWYKHLGRGMTADEISKDDFRKIMIDCLESLK